MAVAVCLIRIQPYFLSMATDNSLCHLSGYHAPYSAYPKHVLIETCKGAPVSRSMRGSLSLPSLQALIQRRYQIHRQLRNEQQAAKLLNTDFPGWLLDPVLQKLVDFKRHPDYVEPRNCVVFLARPPEHLRRVICKIQERLLGFNPSKPSTARC